ncbi:MAG: flavodoxin family protein [Clostridium perfringens]|nr:flavodoxin family protein [Clostridium perfringens]
MKNILLINCSKRKKNTYNLLIQSEKILKNYNFNTEIINLYDYDIKFCLGCEHCILKGGCVLNDDVNTLMEKLKNCHGLIIGTPVYLNNMSGILKTFIDRTCVWFHRSDMAQKPVLLIGNTQGSGVKNTLNSIEESLRQWGVSFCGNISRTGAKIKTVPISYKEISKFINLINNNIDYKPTLKDISYFNVQRALSSSIFPLDKEFWTEHNWINNSYFPKTKINILKQAYGNMVYSILSKNLNKNKN